MATLKEIRHRIGSIKSTQQITKAMKMVAAAKLRRAQQRMLAARPYAQKIDMLIHNLLINAEDFDDPHLERRDFRKIHFVVVTSDRGLCGSFNSNIIKKALAEMDKAKGAEIQVVPVGRKGNDFFKKRNYNIGKEFINFFNEMRYEHATEITKYLANEFIEGRTDQVKLIYNEFKSVAQQNLTVEDLLPVYVEKAEEEPLPNYIFEPSQNEILRHLLPKHLDMQVWKALLESFASEQGARMTAMENATENAEELIHDLTLLYNKTRQASITTEIIEIVSGAEALRGA